MNWLWPTMGLRRALRYWAHRLQRLPGTPQSIAAGFAFGIAMSFTPYVGFHMLGAFALSYAFRANMWAALIGTLCGNPITIPFFWILSFNVGAVLFNLGAAHAHAMPLEQIVATLSGFELSVIFSQQFMLVSFLPLAIGGTVTAVLIWFPTYFITRHLITSHQRWRSEKRMERLAQARERMQRERQTATQADATEAAEAAAGQTPQTATDPVLQTTAVRADDQPLDTRADRVA